MSDQTEVLLAVARRLESAGIAYMVSGSTAMNFYARPRMTRDIDVVIEVRDADVPRLLDAFADGFYIDDEAVTDAVARRSMFNALHEESMVKIDFIVRRDEPYRETEFARRRTIALGETTLTAVAPEDLILSKLLWNRESGSAMQAEDVRNLLSAAVLDETYLEKWSARLGVADRLARLRP